MILNDKKVTKLSEILSKNQSFLYDFKPEIPAFNESPVKYKNILLKIDFLEFLGCVRQICEEKKLVKY